MGKTSGWDLGFQTCSDRLGHAGAKLCLGTDYGQVGGQSTATFSGKHLADAVVSVRGRWTKLGYDFFRWDAATPLSKPAGLRTASVTGKCSLSASFWSRLQRRWRPVRRKSMDVPN